MDDPDLPMLQSIQIDWDAFRGDDSDLPRLGSIHCFAIAFDGDEDDVRERNMEDPTILKNTLTMRSDCVYHHE